MTKVGLHMVAEVQSSVEGSCGIRQRHGHAGPVSRSGFGILSWG